MTLSEHQAALEALEQDADTIALFISSVDTRRLCLIGNIINDELALRYEGKPEDRNLLH